MPVGCLHDVLCFRGFLHGGMVRQYLHVGTTHSVMFLFCVFSLKDPISLKLVRWAK